MDIFKVFDRIFKKNTKRDNDFSDQCPYFVEKEELTDEKVDKEI